MPSYRFSWDAFEDVVVQAVAASLGFAEESGDPRAFLNEAVRRPTEHFVKTTKRTLESVWLPRHPGSVLLAEQLRDRGIGPMGPEPRTPLEASRYIAQCKNSRSVRELLCEALLRHGDLDRSTDDEEESSSGVPRIAILRPSQQPFDNRRPYEYQEQAWNRLSLHLAEAASTGAFQGLVVMPTGSGKTFTSVHWLVRHVIAAGKRILWIAHRHELLEQAAREFHRLAGLAPKRDLLRIRIVSGKHCSTSMMGPADDVLICSVGSLARRPDIVADILRDPERMVIIDEAHHAPAKTYQDVLAHVLGRKPRAVLGITATPTRTMERERPVLEKLFGGRVIYQLEMAPLIEQGFLARPFIVRVKTAAHVDRDVTAEDLRHMARFDELSEDWLNRIAHIASRNELIVEHLAANGEKYGKTLIFAINVEHAALLTERLREREINAEYLASHRPDGTPGRPREVVLSEFERPDSGLDVLVNVQMLTEGVDIPCIQTVFLTRPTSSEILVRQMIGRALRGPRARGTERAYLVSFEDHWERFADWQSSFELVPDLLELAKSSEDSKQDEASVPKSSTETVDPALVLPWEIIRATAATIRAKGLAHHADAFEAVHHGWYLLERQVGDDTIRQTIAVFEHQRPCWEALLNKLASMSSDQLEEAETEELYEEYFDDCDVPRTPMFQVEEMLEHLLAGGSRPVFQPFAERDVCDPYEIAKKIVEDDLGNKARSALISERYTRLAQSIYPSVREFRSAVDDAVLELEDPSSSTRQVRAQPVFESWPDNPLRAGPAHDLEALFADVKEKGRKILSLPEFPSAELQIRWTKRPVKGWWAMAYWSETGVPGKGEIRVNKLLNSPDIAAETLRFLLWHEYLHIYLQQGHTTTFRGLERQWPSYIESDRALDTLQEQFGIQYW